MAAGAAPCGVCGSGGASYRCPRCELPYCALACYKAHGAACTDAFAGERRRDRLAEAGAGLTEGQRREFEQRLLHAYRNGSGEAAAAAASSDEEGSSGGDRVEYLQQLAAADALRPEHLTAAELAAFEAAVARGEVRLESEAKCSFGGGSACGSAPLPPPWWLGQLRVVDVAAEGAAAGHLCCRPGRPVAAGVLGLLLELLYAYASVLRRRAAAALPAGDFEDFPAALAEFAAAAPGIFERQIFEGAAAEPYEGGGRATARRAEVVREAAVRVRDAAAAAGTEERRFAELVLCSDVAALLGCQFKALRAVQEVLEWLAAAEAGSAAEAAGKVDSGARAGGEGACDGFTAVATAAGAATPGAAAGVPGCGKPPFATPSNSSLPTSLSAPPPPHPLPTKTGPWAPAPVSANSHPGENCAFSAAGSRGRSGGPRVSGALARAIRAAERKALFLRSFVRMHRGDDACNEGDCAALVGEGEQCFPPGAEGEFTVGVGEQQR